MPGGQRRAAEVGQLVGMQLDRQPVPGRGGEDPRCLRRRKANPLAERIHRVGQPLGRDRRQHRLADQADILVAVLHFRRHGVRAEETGHHPYRPLPPQRAGRPELPRLGRQFQPVARLDLDRGDALAQQRIQPGQRRVHELLLRGAACRPHRRDDAAPGPGDRLVCRSGEALLELARAVAGIDQVGVAIDQPGQDPPPLAINAVLMRRQLSLRPGEHDAPSLARHRAWLDDPQPGAARV